MSNLVLRTRLALLRDNLDRVAQAKTTIDKASYDPNPPEGVVLVRAGDRLVAPVSRAANW